MKSLPKERVSGSVPASRQSSDTGSNHLKTSKEGKSSKQTGHVNNSSRKSGEVSSTGTSKTAAQRRFKKKPWQKYNARLVSVQGTDSSDSDNDTGKYKKREITDNSLRFEAPEEDEHLLKELKKEEEKDFDELCEEMRRREKANSPDNDLLHKGKIPSSVVLPKDFEKDLDHLLLLNVTQHDLPKDAGYDDPESFTKWLEKC